MDSLTIRKATSKDFPLFYPVFKKLLPALFPEYTKATQDYFIDVQFEKNDLRKSLQENDRHLFLAFANNEVIGFFLTRTVDLGVGPAQWLAVDPHYQGHGIGSKLLQLWEETTLKEGGHTLQIWTGQKNVPFYKNRGFTRMGLFPKAWYGVDVHMLYKTLREPEEKHYLKAYLASKKEKVKK